MEQTEARTRREGRSLVKEYTLLDGRVEVASSAPHPSLLPIIDWYEGYSEVRAAPVLRVEVPFPRIVLILGFGDPIRVGLGMDPAALRPGNDAFVAGLTSQPSLVESDGSQAGVQVNLTPLGAVHLLGLPMADLADTTVDLRELAGPVGGELIERLRDAPTWSARFDLLDRVFRRALEINRPPSKQVDWAWRRLMRDPNGVRVADLAQDLGWSHKHLIARFRNEVGLSPKLYARVVRFDRAVRSLGDDVRPDWARVAMEAGYHDQPHMAREFRQFAQSTPVELWQQRTAYGAVLVSPREASGG